jgi:hypothetical protein
MKHLALMLVAATSGLLSGCGDQWAACGKGTVKHIGECVVIDGGGLQCGPGTHEANGLCVPDTTTAGAPTISATTPDHAGISGGVIYTIQGHGFTGADVTGLSVKFGTVDASFTLATESAIVGVVPPGVAVTAPITVTTSKGTATSPFQYDALIAADGEDYSGGNGYLVDPTNGRWVDLGSLTSVVAGTPAGLNITALAFAPDGTLYAASRSDLYTLDLSTGVGTLVGTFHALDSSATFVVGDMKFLGTTLYAMNISSGSLITINTADAEVTIVGLGLDGFTRGTGLAIDANGTILVSYNNANGPLASVDKTNGDLTTVATLDGTSAHIAAFAYGGTTLYAAAINGWDGNSVALDTVDATTGHVTRLFELPAVVPGTGSHVDALATPASTLVISKLATATWHEAPAAIPTTAVKCTGTVHAIDAWVHPAPRQHVALSTIASGSVDVATCGGRSLAIAASEMSHYAIVGTRRGKTKLVDTRTGRTVLRGVSSITARSSQF